MAWAGANGCYTRLQQKPCLHLFFALLVRQWRPFVRTRKILWRGLKAVDVFNMLELAGSYVLVAVSVCGLLFEHLDEEQRTFTPPPFRRCNNAS